MTAIINNGGLKFKMRVDQTIKLICIICFNMTVGALVVARNSPAIAYEPSIYTATPFIVWLVLFINLVCGIGIVVHQVGSSRHKKNNLWLLGILLIFMSYTILLSLWIIRGYALWGEWDPFDHLGLLYSVMSSGHIDTFYPITHILLAQISCLCDISPVIFYNILPVIFGVYYVLFMYLLAKSILPNKGQIIMTSLVSMTLMYNASYLQLTPGRLANLALPLSIYIIINSLNLGTVRWNILLIIMFFLFPPFHPVAAFLVVLTLLTIGLVSVPSLTAVCQVFGKTTNLKKLLGGEFHIRRQTYFVVRKNLISNLKQIRDTVSLTKERKFSKHTNTFWLNYSSIFLFLVWMIFWMLPFQVWADLIIIAENSGITPPVTNWSFHDYMFIQIPFWLKSFGGVLLCIIFAICAIPILNKKIRLQPDLWKLVSLYGPLCTCLFFIIVSFFKRAGFDFFFRLQVYVIILGTLFVGFVLYELIERANQTHTQLTKIAPFIVIVFLVVLFLFGSARLYESSFTYDNNYQVTRTEIDGMDWFLHNKNVITPITGISVPPGQFAKILLYSEELSNRSDIDKSRGMIPMDLRLPSHLGYDKNSNMGDLYPNFYVVLNARDKILYQGPLSGLNESTYLPQDFERLSYDSTVYPIYSNGGLDVYFIRSASIS